MAKYATTEDLYDCPKCGTRFALRETKAVGTNPVKPLHECPGCKDSFVMFDTAHTIAGDLELQVWGLQSMWSEEDRARELNHPNIIAPFPINKVHYG